MTPLTNNHDIPLLLAAWLLSDDYDYIHDPNYISATSLMRPVKELILTPRVDTSLLEPEDLSDRIARSLGNAVHNAVERVWESPTKLGEVLPKLGINPIQVEVNPEKPNPEKTQVYIEQRSFRKIAGFTVGGKFDAVIEGIVHDIKTTSAWGWTHGTKDDDYRLQGSIYKWLNPDKIIEDFIRVCFAFTDWQAGNVGRVEGYPDARIKYKDIPLLSEEEIETWIRKRLNQIKSLRDADEDRIPACTDEEVWLEKPKFRYFTDPMKIDGRATRVFDDHDEAMKYFSSKGKGIVITTPPRARKCQKYCSAFTVCKQKDKYVHD